MIPQLVNSMLRNNHHHSTKIIINLLECDTSKVNYVMRQLKTAGIPLS